MWISLQAIHFKWKDVEIPIIKDDESDTMSIFYNERKKRNTYFKLDNVPAEDRMVTNIPQVIMLPTLLGPVFADDTKTAWDLYVIVKEWMAPRDDEVRILVRPILEWLLWSSLQGRNKDTSLAETKNLAAVTLPSQKLKEWMKLRLEGTLGKWPVDKTEVVHHNAGAAVAAAALMTTSQAESFFVHGAATMMQMNGDLNATSTSGRKKFSERQWSALIGFCGVVSKKQLPRIWKQIEKAKDAVEVWTLVIDAIRAKQVDIDKHTSRVWFGEDIAEDIMKVGFAHGSIANVAKPDRGISVMIFIRWTAQEIYDMEEEEEERHKITHVTAEMLKKLAKKQRMPPTTYDTGIRLLETYSLFLKVLLGTKSPHLKGVERVRAGLLNLSEREELVGADYLAHVYWLILDDSCLHFSTPLTPDAVRARYFDDGSVILPGTTLNRLADKIACQEVLLSQTIPKQWLG